MGPLGARGWYVLAAAAVLPLLPWDRPRALLVRLGRNAFLPPMPRAVEPRYPLVPESVLASEITVVVGTKDSITPTISQLRHLSEALPRGVRVIYTYPQPMWEDAAAYEERLREAAQPFGRRARLLPVSSFSNPFEAWLEALPLVRTTYTLLMHNDVFLLDTRGHFLSELYGALEAHTEHAVASPQIYETELKGLLTTHLFNTNLHLRLNGDGVAYMSHEVDLITGLSREASDFEQRLNSDFLEDHVFLARTSALGGGLVDPKAAFTLEYVDLQLNMIRHNLSQLYVPSARAEFRLWHFGWQDVPYFVRRRSEEQARLTKAHLERKWGVEFPNTGFCNFVKFSIIRHVSLLWNELPSCWIEQAALVVAWFEMIGFNRHNEAPLDSLLPGLHAAAKADAGLRVTSRRHLVSTSKVAASDWVASGIGTLLRFEPAAVRLETRYQVEHMSLAVLKVPLRPPFHRSSVAPLCGMLVRERAADGSSHDVCWIYVAPHRFDHPLFQAIESLLVRLKVGPRIALALAMKLTNSNLEPGRHDGQIRALRAAGVDVTMCGEHHWRCEVEYEFAPKARLLAWSGRMNSWPKVVRTLLPHAEELHALYAAMALLVCLGAAATAYSAMQAKSAVGVLALDWVLTLLGVRLAHAPILAHAATIALLRPSMRAALFCSWLVWLAAVNTALVSRVESLAFATSVVALCSARRVYLALLTLRANHKPSLAMPLLCCLRLTGSHPNDPAAPPAQFDEQIVNLDGPTAALRTRRRAALAALRARWLFRWPRSNEVAAALCGALHEAMPLECVSTALLKASADAAADSTARPLDDVTTAIPSSNSTGQLPDQPTSSQHSITAHAKGADAAPPNDVVAPDMACAPRPMPSSAGAVDATDLWLRRIVDENRNWLRRLSRKAEVHFHLSGSEALQATARLLRVNTRRPLIVTFGGAAHGWTDGVLTEGVGLGEERYACNVLTLRERSSSTLAVLRLRRDEIAAVVVSPLQGVATADAPRGDERARRASPTYREWLAELRDLCTHCELPLVFDEAATAFRLAAGGAQEYFGVDADIVCYGKSAGGGLPLGVVCGPARLLASSEPRLPLRAGAEGGSGGVDEHPALMGSTNAFLRSLHAELCARPGAYRERHTQVSAWAARVNSELRDRQLPMRIDAEASVWSIRFLRAGRHHWLLLAYLAESQARFHWIGPRRLCLSERCASEGELDALRRALVGAAEAMVSDGWWPSSGEMSVSSEMAICTELLREAARDTCARLLGAARSLL